MAKKAKNARIISIPSQGISALIPNKFYLVAGHSEGMTPLNAFDNALMDAGIGNTNLVKMSSILPPGCKKIQPVKLPLGALVPVAYASKVSSQTDEVISAAVAVAIPKDPKKNGLIMEYSAAGHKKEVETIVRHMAMEGMKTRGYALKEVLSTVAEHPVNKIGAAYAAVVLWW